MAKQNIVVCTFILGFALGFSTCQINFLVQSFWDVEDDTIEQTHRIDRIEEVQRHENLNLDPFPLPPCQPNRTSALYVFYGRPVRSEGKTLFGSIKTLLKSGFPGRVRLVIDEKVNKTIREDVDREYRHLLEEIELNVVSMPDLYGKELIPHSNKIRALQARALIYGNDTNECTVSLDMDTYVHHEAPWNNLLSILQLNDVAVAHDCDVPIDGVPDFLSNWMPNTGVMALRNTPRVRMVLRDWLKYFVPCNATHVSTCTPGTDQYPFLQLAVKHAVRLHKLDKNWNCRLTPTEIDAGIDGFPVYSLNILSKQDDPRAEGASISTTCGGNQKCHILHGHWLKYP